MCGSGISGGAGEPSEQASGNGHGRWAPGTARAESGKGRRRCRQDWVQGIVNQCRESEVPVFVKQIHDAKGKLLKAKVGPCSRPGRSLQGEAVWPDAWPAELRVREWPSFKGQGATD